jgi:hypothetical protein
MRFSIYSSDDALEPTRIPYVNARKAESFALTTGWTATVHTGIQLIRLRHVGRIVDYRTNQKVQLTNHHPIGIAG